MLGFLLILLTAPALAQSVPTLNVEPSCRAESKESPGLKQNFNACMTSEKKARDEVTRQWQKFTAADRAGCRALVTIGGSPGTYTELITCLEMKRDVRALNNQPQTGGTTGQSPR